MVVAAPALSRLFFGLPLPGALSRPTAGQDQPFRTHQALDSKGAPRAETGGGRGPRTVPSGGGPPGSRGGLAGEPAEFAQESLGHVDTLGQAPAPLPPGPLSREEHLGDPGGRSG